jgi:light-regulated signal transduction histidine kinase (bacteriophytochrome)
MRSVVLNVDPDPETRPAVTQILRSLAIDVQETASAAEAIRLARALQPALAVVSSRIDRGEDSGFCRDLAGASSALILLRVAPQHKRLAANLNGTGADGYVIEPVQAAALAAAARSLLRVWAAEQERAVLKRDLDQAMDDFYLCIARASHDFSQSVRGFTTLCDLVAPEVTQWPPAKIRYLEQVTESADRSQGLLKDLASYVQISRESVGTHRNMDLQGAVFAAQVQEQAKIDETGAEIRAEALPMVRGNPSRLQQLMACLLSNSLKYRSPGTPPRIRIQAVRESDEWWRISVSDNGIGIEPQYHESIFTPFQRLHGRDVPGAGMGLAMCRKIVKAHGGRIWVESSAGCGAKFLFTLPAGKASVASALP